MTVLEELIESFDDYQRESQNESITIEKLKEVIKNDFLEKEKRQIKDFCNHLNTYKGLEEIRFDFMLSDFLTEEGFKNLTVKLFDPKTTKPKLSDDDPTFSVDVCVIDEEDVHGLAYYSFENEKWVFHTDTLVDYDEAGNETKWMWYYPVVSASNVF